MQNAYYTSDGEGIWLFYAVGHMFHIVPAQPQQRHARSLVVHHAIMAAAMIDVESNLQKELQTPPNLEVSYTAKPTDRRPAAPLTGTPQQTLL